MEEQSSAKMREAVVAVHGALLAAAKLAVRLAEEFGETNIEIGEGVRAALREAGLELYKAGSKGALRDESVQARCLDCSHIGSRTFARDAKGVWRDVLGGSNGLTPDGLHCSLCGSVRFVLVRVIEIEAKER